MILKAQDYHPSIIISVFLHFTNYTCKSHALTIYFSVDQWIMLFFIFSVEYRNDVFQWEKCKHSTCETVYFKLFNWPAADIQRVLFDKYHHSKSGLCYLINQWIICNDATVSNYLLPCKFTTDIQYICTDRLSIDKDFVSNKYSLLDIVMKYFRISK